MSAELSDMEIGQKIFKCEEESIVDIKEFNDGKFYLVKDDLGANVSQLSKYILGRYINKISYPCIENGKYGYRQEFICDDIYENKMSPIIYGKNTDESKVIITLKDKTYEQNIKKDSYFMVIYPEMISFDKDELKQIYSKERNKIISIKFVDDKGEEIKTLDNLDIILE
ncbi:hypothetical protein [Terrisporobacter sp.]